MDEEEYSERELLRFLTDGGYLDGPAKGIALQVIDKGRESLKCGQVAVFEKYVKEEYFNLECSRCGCPIPTSEVIFALMEEDGLCSWCRKMVSNDD